MDMGALTQWGKGLRAKDSRGKERDSIRVKEKASLVDSRDNAIHVANMDILRSFALTAMAMGRQREKAKNRQFVTIVAIADT